jgi:hypothetical protein
MVLLAAVCAWPATVEAREVVEFTDGRYLEIRSYVVQGDLIRLDVDRGSFLVIPVASVDEIRRDWDVVFSRRGAVLPGPRTARATPARNAPEGQPREASRVARALARSGS